ncbi:iron ABC transporter permease [Microbacterium caowuchunii]|uniref:ABC transporter permease n=1 Tax=Microbacterium caowuchunii TaxID=2614638 RepID=UPI0012467814|nr:iron ABC transporter permease [Microbacterium caowuchunii]QEW00865.1 iron ABC transporter permease [Microbacterium caowuchunii]
MRRLPAEWRGERLFGKVLLGVALVILFVLFLWPPIMMAMAAFRVGNLAGQGAWSITPFLETLGKESTWRVSLNSVILSAASSLGALAIGTFLAWVAVRTTTPLRRWMTPVMAVILVIPSLFYGLGWYLVVNGNAAPVNIFLREVFGITGSPLGSGWPTMLFVVIGFVVPVGYLFMVGPMARMDAALDDAARMNGASRGSAFFTVTLPLLRPTMFGVFVLMTSYGFSAFELPLLFGIQSDINVFSTAVYTTLTAQESVPNYAGASTLSLILMALVLALVLLRSRVLGGRKFSTITGKGFRPDPKSYGRIQWLFLAVFLAVVCWAGVIPLVQMILGSFQPMFGMTLGFTTAHYDKLLSNPRTGSLIAFTLALAAVGGFIAAAVALIMSHLSAQSGRFLRSATAAVSWAPVAIPGVLVGLALITAYLPIPGLRNLIGTPVMLLFGFIVVVTPVATRAIEGGVLQIANELQESARISGASKIVTFFTVVVPLVLPSFLAGWFIAGVGIAGNLSLPVLLSSPSMQTVAVQAYDSYRQGYAPEAAAIFLLLMLTVVVVGAVAWAVLAGGARVLNRLRLTRIERATLSKGSVVHV